MEIQREAQSPIWGKKEDINLLCDPPDLRSEGSLGEKNQES